MCTCQPGYTGINCETLIDNCDSSPCVRGSCMSGPNYFMCACPVGYSGTRCELAVNNCDLFSPACLNNGTCVNQPSMNSYSCICPAPFTGSRCETDYCATRPCVNGICSSTSTGFVCTCLTGYTGQTCAQVIDMCASNPCGVCNIFKRSKLNT